jgi:hypothetical protein
MHRLCFHSLHGTLLSGILPGSEDSSRLRRAISDLPLDKLILQEVGKGHHSLQDSRRKLDGRDIDQDGGHAQAYA